MMTGGTAIALIIPSDAVHPLTLRCSMDSIKDDELATVCSVANPAEAEVIRVALEGEGIRSFAEGSQQAGLAGTLGVPIRIQVAAGDLNRANKIIRKGESEARRH